MFNNPKQQLEILHQQIDKKCAEYLTLLHSLQAISKQTDNQYKVKTILNAYHFDSIGQIKVLYGLLNGLREKPQQTIDGYIAYELVCARQFPNIVGQELQKKIFQTKYKLLNFATNNIKYFVKFYNQAIQCLHLIKHIKPTVILNSFLDYDPYHPNPNDICHKFFNLFEKLQKIGFPGFKDKTLKTFMINQHNCLGLWSGSTYTYGGARDKAFHSNDICEAIVSDLNFLFLIAKNINENLLINNALSMYFVAHIKEDTTINIYLDTDNCLIIRNCLWDVELFTVMLKRIDKINFYMAQPNGIYNLVEMKDLWVNRKSTYYQITITDSLQELDLDSILDKNPIIELYQNYVKFFFKNSENEISHAILTLNTIHLLKFQRFNNQTIILSEQDLKLFREFNKVIFEYNTNHKENIPKICKPLKIAALQRLIQPLIQRIKEKKHTLNKDTVFESSNTNLSHFSSSTTTTAATTKVEYRTELSNSSYAYSSKFLNTEIPTELEVDLTPIPQEGKFTIPVTSEDIIDQKQGKNSERHSNIAKDNPDAHQWQRPLYSQKSLSSSSSSIQESYHSRHAKFNISLFTKNLDITKLSL